MVWRLARHTVCVYDSDNAAAHQDRFLYRNFAGGTLETEGEHGA